MAILVDIFHASATIFAFMASEKYIYYTIYIVRLKVDSFIWLYAQFQALTFMMYCYIYVHIYMDIYACICGMI